jgi:hypothetical protein
MAFAMFFGPHGITRQDYESAVEGLRAKSGQWPPDGSQMHVAFEAEGQVVVFELWDSAEKAQAFGEMLMPFLAERGIHPAPPLAGEVISAERA